MYIDALSHLLTKSNWNVGWPSGEKLSHWGFAKSQKALLTD